MAGNERFAIFHFRSAILNEMPPEQSMARNAQPGNLAVTDHERVPVDEGGSIRQDESFGPERGLVDCVRLTSNSRSADTSKSF